jgi:hypothetical protein
MPDNNNQNPAPGKEMADVLRSWVMVALTLIFVGLYAAALTGWLRPLADEKMVTRLEPVIFVIIGYYFGRLPAQQNEKTLKDEIGRQTQKADAAQHAKEQAQQARETLEEKVKNARAVLAEGAANGPAARRLGAPSDHAAAPVREDPLRGSVAAAVSILSS